MLRISVIGRPHTKNFVNNAAMTGFSRREKMLVATGATRG